VHRSRRFGQIALSLVAAAALVPLALAGPSAASPLPKGCVLKAHGHCRGANLRGRDLSGAHLESIDLRRAILVGADLTGAHLTRANLTRANLAGADLTGADLAGANVAGARLSGADVTGAHWSNTICPDRSNSTTHGGTCVGHGVR